MRTLKTSEAAALLAVSPNTLRAWERRFDYPKPRRSPGRHRLYTYAEVSALAEALHEGLSISSAVSVAREGLDADGGSLVPALLSLRYERADQVMEGSLALRPIERSVEEVLLPALDVVHHRRGQESAPWAFAVDWGVEWLRRAQRISRPRERSCAVLIGDASEGHLDPLTPHIRALELFCVRGGAEVLTLPVTARSGLNEVLGALRPRAVVVAGDAASADDVAKWAYALRASGGALPTALYRRSHAGVCAGPGDVAALAASPSQALAELLELLAAEPSTPVRLAPAAG